MDDGADHNNPDPGVISDSSCWTTLGSTADAANYFFSGDRHESSILSDFGWSCATTSPTGWTGGLTGSSSSGLHGSGFGSLDVASSSSEDPAAEKSTGSGGKPASGGKSKKKAEKRIRQPRFAFMTKTEIDHLEDGYRWRKYGQKAVQNSPYPRSYYRCINSKCTVKKRVERSSQDPTTVITTYEGQHCHHTVGFPHGASAFGGPLLTAAPMMSHFYHVPGAGAIQFTRGTPSPPIMMPTSRSSGSGKKRIR